MRIGSDEIAEDVAKLIRREGTDRRSERQRDRVEKFELTMYDFCRNIGVQALISGTANEGAKSRLCGGDDRTMERKGKSVASDELAEGELGGQTRHRLVSVSCVFAEEQNREYL